MQFGTPHDHAIAFPFHHSQEKVWIWLILRSFTPITLWIGHGPIYHQIIDLNSGPIFSETLMVIRSMLLIAFIGDTEDRVGCIQPDTSLETTGRYVSTVPLHHHLFYQVFGALVQVSKTIDLFP
jgi:hypothetical protein